MKWLLTFILLIPTVSFCEELSIFKMRDVYLLNKKFGPNSRNPLIDQNGLENRELDWEISLIWTTDVLKYGYFDNKVLSYVDRFKDTGKSDQFRLVGWNFTVGVKLLGWFWLEYEHFSKHQLDNKAPGRFPVEDSIGARIYFYRSNYETGLLGY